jgi:hypothetical protein
MNEADWEMASELGLRSLRLAAHGVVSGLGEVAQLVEHATENRGVAGSSPALAICGKPGGKRCDGRFPPISLGVINGGFRARNGHSGQLLLGPPEQPVETLPVLSFPALLQLRLDVHRHGRVRVGACRRMHPGAWVRTTTWSVALGREGGLQFAVRRPAAGSEVAGGGGRTGVLRALREMATYDGSSFGFS